MIISLIVAMDHYGLIGRGNELPWGKSAFDIKHFRKITMGKPVIMGRRTFESLGKRLAGRINIILTRNQDYKAPGCLIAYSRKEALSLASEYGPDHSEEVMIIGGADIYEQFLPLAGKMYVTFVRGDFSGNVFFPKFNTEEWARTAMFTKDKDRNNPYNISICIFERK